MSETHRDPLSGDQLKAVIESLLFVSGDPVPLKRLADVVEREPEEVKKIVQEMMCEHENNPSRGLIVLEVAGGYQMRTVPLYAPYVHRFLDRKKLVTLTGPALETLAIVAYRQPLARAEIEAIRGVSVDGVLRSLLDKRLLKVVGVGEGAGKPHLYGTTKAFLEQFGLRSLDDLPPIEDLKGTFAARTDPTDRSSDLDLTERDEGNGEVSYDEPVDFESAGDEE